MRKVKSSSAPAQINHCQHHVHTINLGESIRMYCTLLGQRPSLSEEGYEKRRQRQVLTWDIPPASDTSTPSGKSTAPWRRRGRPTSATSRAARRSEDPVTVWRRRRRHRRRWTATKKTARRTVSCDTRTTTTWRGQKTKKERDKLRHYSTTVENSARAARASWRM